MNNAPVTPYQKLRDRSSLNSSAKLHAFVHHDQRLTVVAATKEKIQSLGSVLETVYQVLLVMQSNPSAPCRRAPSALQTKRCAKSKIMNPSIRARRVIKADVFFNTATSARLVVLRDRAAQYNSGAHRENAQHGVENLARPRCRNTDQRRRGRHHEVDDVS